jgi:hypothetical protein
MRPGCWRSRFLQATGESECRVRDRMRQLALWPSELQDTRLSDAAYVSVVIEVPAVDAAALARLKAAFAGLPKMHARLVLAIGVELPLEGIDLDQLNAAASWLRT